MDRQLITPPSIQADRSNGGCAVHDIDAHQLCAGILHTVAYSDIFDYPLTAQEIHRYLIGVRASLGQVRSCLHDSHWASLHLSERDGYFALPGREAVVDTRRRRTQVSAALWRKAARYSRWIASLPFVRMVAVTGTLAVDNAEPGADVDYLIVTEPNRLWIVRTLVVAWVHVAKLERLELCPNYLLTLDALDRFDRSLFTAHELAQMIPLYGSAVYDDLLGQNDWARSFLPNAFEARNVSEARQRCTPAWTGLKWALEVALAGGRGDRWEKRIQAAKIPQLIAQANQYGSKSAIFTPQLCKGHMGDHDRQIAGLYQTRVNQTDHPT